MTTPFKVNLTIYQGSTFRWRATLKSGSPAVPVDLTGYTARMQIRTTVDAAAAEVDLTTENGGITLGDAAGTIDLYLTAAATTLYAWPEGVYDLELIAPNGDVTRRLRGGVVVSPEVTR